MIALTVSLGGHNDRPAVQLHTQIDCEYGPEDIFEACNRIRALEADLGELPHGWQRDLRRQLDERNAPSMSVGDWFEVSLDDRTQRTFCHPFGWGHSMHPEAVTR